METCLNDLGISATLWQDQDEDLERTAGLPNPAEETEELTTQSTRREGIQDRRNTQQGTSSNMGAMRRLRVVVSEDMEEVGHEEQDEEDGEEEEEEEEEEMGGEVVERIQKQGSGSQKVDTTQHVQAGSGASEIRSKDSRRASMLEELKRLRKGSSSRTRKSE